MASSANRRRLEPEQWRRICAVLDRLAESRTAARSDALAEACKAEGLRPEDVEPFLSAERQSDGFLQQLDSEVVNGALRDLVAPTDPAALAPGSRLGPYEIVGSIGAGGMGQVYKARDTRLSRTVAIKLLAPDVARRAEGRQRFEREARAISALNHPHVCTLYDVSQQDGIDFLVMELLDGETLASRLHRGPLPVDEAVRHAVQIADALAAAHRQGVVHRDLKPANIMLTARGVKLLDFGLAALRTPYGSVDARSDPTITVEGTVVGTLAYMAPEQLHGRSADARSDIFALGAVLYEMLAGHRAFVSESAAGAIAAVLEREPEALQKSRPEIPAPLESTIRTCLAKNPDDRWQNAADLARHLDSVLAVPATQPEAAARSSRGIRAAWLAAAVVTTGILTALITGAVWRDASPSTSPSVARFTLEPPDGHVFAGNLALAPDGRRIAFVAGPRQDERAIWMRAIDALAGQRLGGTEGASYPFWSPDGQFIAFFAGNALKKVQLDSGAVETICNCDTGGGGGGTWNRAGVILFSKGLVISPLWRVPASGGKAVPVTPLGAGGATDPMTGTNTWPQFLPDGKRFLWLTGAQGSPGLYVGHLDSGDRESDRESTQSAIPVLQFSREHRGPGERTRGWYAGGYLFFTQQQALMAQRFSLERLELVGEPVRLVEEVEQTAPGRSFFDVAPGVLAYRPPGNPNPLVQLVWFDRSGRQVGTLASPARYTGVALSPDERDVLAGSGSGLVRIDTASGIPTPVGLRGNATVWSPDGARFALSGGALAAPVPSIASVANPHDVKVAGVPGTGQAWPSDWSRDGRHLVGTVLHSETGLDGWAADIQATPATLRYVLRVPGNQIDQRIAPDGRWVAYASNERAETYEVFVRRFPEGSGLWRVSTAGGRLPSWTADGRELLYVAPDGTLMSVAVRTTPDFSFKQPEPLFRHDALQPVFNRDPLFGRAYDVVSGRRILVGVRVSEQPPPAPIVVVLNWERLVGRAAEPQR